MVSFIFVLSGCSHVGFSCSPSCSSHWYGNFTRWGLGRTCGEDSSGVSKLIHRFTWYHWNQCGPINREIRFYLSDYGFLFKLGEIIGRVASFWRIWRRKIETNIESTEIHFENADAGRWNINSRFENSNFWIMKIKEIQLNLVDSGVIKWITELPLK